MSAWIFLIPPALVLLWAVLTYNTFVRLRQQVSESWAGIDTELKRRYELIPNLVAAVKGYAAHERQTIEAVVAARARAAASTGSPGQQARDEQELVTSVNRLLAVAEAYPDLKASTNFLQPAEGAGQHRGPDPGRAPLLQRQRARSQHARGGLPQQSGGGDVRGRSRRNSSRSKARPCGRSSTCLLVDEDRRGGPAVPAAIFAPRRRNPSPSPAGSSSHVRQSAAVHAVRRPTRDDPSRERRCAPRRIWRLGPPSSSWAPPVTAICWIPPISSIPACRSTRLTAAVFLEARARLAVRHGLRTLHVGGEVRPHTQEFIDLAARIYAAHGLRVHLRPTGDRARRRSGCRRSASFSRSWTAARTSPPRTARATRAAGSRWTATAGSCWRWRR